ncbi:hypothetical protein SAMN06296386_11664 [Lachnospiraceae bacterium]|nr:hypothetical protein SAMN06296386_11664 [Lachnospiraceae bacterium]
MSEKDLTVDGYLFNSSSDAENARNELKNIAYIKEHLDKNNPESVLKIYNKLVTKRIFSTPPGYRFLKDLQELLLTYPSIVPEDVLPLPLSFMMSFDKDSDTSRKPAKKVIPMEKKDVNKERFFVSAVINVVLVIAIVAMLVLTLNSDQPNILNYETAIQNRYSTWEQELAEREKAVKEKERALGVEGGSSDGSDQGAGR